MGNASSALFRDIHTKDNQVFENRFIRDKSRKQEMDDRRSFENRFIRKKLLQRKNRNQTRNG